jgi:phage repressor protein C with HTH and peptisase S24 domain
MTTLGERIREKMQAKGWSEAELARRAGGSQPTINALTTGRQQSSRHLPSIAAALDVTAVDLDPRIGSLRPASSPAALSSEVPVYGSVEGGDGGLMIHKEPIDYAPRPQPLGGAPTGYLVYISGESMVPAFRPGEQAIVHDRLPPLPDEPCIFYTNDGGDDRACIKHLVRITADAWHVEQYNPPKTFTLDRADWPVCHRVIGKFSRR